MKRTVQRLARNSANVAEHLLIGTAAALLLACATPQIAVQFDREEDFSMLRTFAWYPNRSPAQVESRRRFPDQQAAADRAVESQLVAQGFPKVPRESADFLVAHHLSLERRLVWRGSASQRLAIDEVPTPDQVEQRVAEILARFPPAS